MIKFSAQNAGTGQPVLGIGLTREECERLLKGQPIHFPTDGMGAIPLLEVYLIAGETEASMTIDMVRAGRVDLKIIRDEPLDPDYVRPSESKGAN